MFNNLLYTRYTKRYAVPKMLRLFSCQFVCVETTSYSSPPEAMNPDRSTTTQQHRIDLLAACVLCRTSCSSTSSTSSSTAEYDIFCWTCQTTSSLDCFRKFMAVVGNKKKNNTKPGTHSEFAQHVRIQAATPAASTSAPSLGCSTSASAPSSQPPSPPLLCFPAP